jgi:hypothetical protein
MTNIMDANSIQVDIGFIDDVHILTFDKNDFVSHDPISIGDSGICVFTNTGISAWSNFGNKSNEDAVSRNTLSNCIFIPTQDFSKQTQAKLLESWERSYLENTIQFIKEHALLKHKNSSIKMFDSGIELKGNNVNILLKMLDIFDKLTIALDAVSSAIAIPPASSTPQPLATASIITSANAQIKAIRTELSNVVL